jgi:hypothetical protein
MIYHDTLGVYFLRKKSEVFENIKYFKAHEKTESERNIKILHKDNGGGGGGICELICPTYLFRGKYTAAKNNTLHSTIEWSSQEKEHVPQGDGHLHIAYNISTFPRT